MHPEIYSAGSPKPGFFVLYVEIGKKEVIIHGGDYSLK
jgi:hypothetical protein